jgi:hypothetical protein
MAGAQPAPEGRKAIDTTPILIAIRKCRFGVDPMPAAHDERCGTIALPLPIEKMPTSPGIDAPRAGNSARMPGSQRHAASRRPSSAGENQ